MSTVAAGERFVTSDGTALHVVEHGAADAPVTVLLVHGWTLDHRSWLPVADRLGAGVRVLGYDHRGHGRSAPAAEGTATVAQLADDLAELIRHRVDGQVVLAGHSMGGMTVMALAERHPELLWRVVGAAFVGTSCAGMDRVTLGLPGVFGTAAVRGERVLGRGMLRLRRRALLRRSGVLRPAVRWLVFGRGPRRADVAETAAQIGRVHPRSMAAFRDSISTHDRRAALAALRGTPCVVIVGERDRLCPVPHARVIAHELGDADLLVHPGVGHMLSYERPDEVTAAIHRLIPAAHPTR